MIILILLYIIEFAKEAMHCQPLDHGEVLSIRWAHDDPNPVAKDSIQRADKDALAALLKAKGISITPANFDYPADYQLPNAKRMKIEEGGSVVEQFPEMAYPDTDAQYAAYYASMGINVEGGEASSSSTGQKDGEEGADEAAKKDALARLGIYLDDEEEEQEKPSTTAATKEEDDESSAEEEEEGGWQQFVDESTGATYYFNTATGESSWVNPEEGK
jgi:hypothetical protein